MIRSARNARRHGEVPVQPKLAVMWTRDTALDLVNSLSSHDHARTEPEWHPPPSGMIKINVVGSSFMVRISTALLEL